VDIRDYSWQVFTPYYVTHLCSTSPEIPHCTLCFMLTPMCPISLWSMIVLSLLSSISLVISGYYASEVNSRNKLFLTASMTHLYTRSFLCKPIDPLMGSTCRHVSHRENLSYLPESVKTKRPSEPCPSRLTQHCTLFYLSSIFLLQLLESRYTRLKHDHCCPVKLPSL
jgi:hypothetical protein